MVLKSMRFRLGTLLWISLFLVLVGVLTSSQNVGRTQTQYIKGDDSRLEGKHLRVVLGEGPITIPRRRGEVILIINMRDLFQDILTWLSQRYNFSYVLLQLNNTLMDPSQAGPGVLSYLRKGECDLVMYAIVVTSKRFEVIDFSHPWYIDPLILVIPNPFLSTNVGAVWQPFSSEVWIAVAISPIILVSVLLCFNNLTPYTENLLATSKLRQPFIYVVGTLLNQGAFCSTKKMRFRLVAGAWCLGVAVIVNIYNCTLISHLFAQKYYPLTRSIYDLADQKNTQLVVRRAFGVDALISAAESGVLKQLGDKIRSYPESRCSQEQQCLDLVKSGSHVYINAEFVALSAIRDDYKTSKRCEFAVVKEAGWSIPMSFGVPKNGPFTEEINRAVLTLHATGLMDNWMRTYKPPFKQCPIAINGEKVERMKSKTSLTIKNLTGAFVVLGIGYCFSVIFLMGEIVFALTKYNY